MIVIIYKGFQLLLRKVWAFLKYTPVLAIQNSKIDSTFFRYLLMGLHITLLQLLLLEWHLVLLYNKWNRHMQWFQVGYRDGYFGLCIHVSIIESLACISSLELMAAKYVTVLYKMHYNNLYHWYNVLFARSLVLKRKDGTIRQLLSICIIFRARLSSKWRIYVKTAYRTTHNDRG